MPELATPTPYRLPQVRYVAPSTPAFEPTQIVPDLRGAAALKGSAASMGLVADTLAKLPDLINKGAAQGRRNAQAKEVHNIKMGALRGEKSPAEIRALEGFQFGEDDSLAYRPKDPALAALEYDAALANVSYRKALAEKARRGPVDPYEAMYGDAPLPTDAGVDPTADTGNGGILPPLPGMENAPAPVAVGVAPASAAQRGALEEAPLPSEPALGADTGTAPPVAKVVNRGALAGFAGPASGPLQAADLPLPQPEAATAPALAAAATEVLPPVPANAAAPAATPAAAPVLRGRVLAPKGSGEAHKYYDEQGNLTHVMLPGPRAKWEKVTTKPEGITFASKEAAEAAGFDTAGAQVNKDGTITVKKIPVAKDQPVPASLAKEARDLGLTAYGKDPKTVEEEIINYRRAQSILSPEQVKNVNALQTKLSSDVAYKDIQNVKQAYVGMQSAAQQDSAISDIALINSFQRIVDPGVSVREGDVALIQNSQGLMRQIEALPAVLSGDERLHPDMKKEIIRMGEQLYKDRVKNFYSGKGKTLVDQAAAYNVPSELLGLDFGVDVGVPVPGKEPKTTAAGKPNGQPAEGGFVVGKKYRGEDGTTKTYLGGPLDNDASWGD